MNHSEFTDRMQVEIPEKVKKNSLARRLGAFGIEISFDSNNSAYLATEKPLSIEEWQKILKDDLR